MNFWTFFWIFFGFFEIFEIFLNIIFFSDIFFSCDFFKFFLKLLKLLINLKEVTTEHQKWLKIGTNRIKAFFARVLAEALEVSPCMRRQSVVPIQDFL